MQQRVEAARCIEFVNVVGTPDVTRADEYLRYGPTTAALEHLLALLGLSFDVDLLIGDTFGLEQRASPFAIRTPGFDVHDDLRCAHQSRA